VAQKYQPAMALREHMLDGKRVSLLEAMLLFGVQNPNAEFARLKQDGFIVKSEKCAMAKIIRRINEYTQCATPANLPVREIVMTEYWISK
jgi:hypothetical protein